MADGHGGYRPPANPSPVSGPGALSRRTDGKQPIVALPDAKYGENAAFQQAEAAAPIPQVQTPPTPPPGAAPGGPQAQQGPIGHPPVPLSQGTLLPNQPVTSGADSGPGPGAASLNLPNPAAGQYTSALQMIQGLSSAPNASPAVRFLATRLGGGF